MSWAKPLRPWLALRFLLAGMLPLLLVAALLLWVLLPQVLAEIETRHQALARAISGQVEVHLRSAGRELSAVAEYLQQRGLQPASFWFEPILDAHVGSGEVFAAIYVADAADSVYAVGLPPGQRRLREDLLAVDLSRWAVLREARQRQAPVWSDVFLSAVSGRLTVSLAMPVGNQVLVGEVAIDRLAEFIGHLPAEAGMSTMILDRQGQIIADSHSRLGGQQLNLGHLPIVGDALRGRFVSHELELEGEKFIATLVSVPQLGWTVLVAQPRSDALQPFQSIFWVLAAGALVALLLATSATLLLARGFARRIGRYAAQAHAIAEGNYDQSWPLSQIREFDSLADDLDRMSLAIRQRERDLAASEARYRSLISNAPVMIFQFDQEGVFELSEGKGLASAGLTPGEAVGQSLFTLYRDYPEIAAQAQRALGGEALQFVSRFGDTFFDTYFNPVRAADGSLKVIGVAVDITERSCAEEALRRANRQLRMISECNQALIRATDESELLRTICRIVVEVGGYRMAWVGYAEHDEQRTVRPMAHAGHEAGYLEGLNTTWAEAERGRGANGTAIRTGRPCVIPNVAADPRFTPWRTEAVERGYAALCALPLIVGEQTLGALSIYAAAADAFDGDEVALLSELAEDLAFGISVLRMRLERGRTDRALQESEARYRLLFDSNPHAMWVLDAETRAFLTVNDAAVASYGFSRSEFQDMTIMDLSPDEDSPLLSEDIVAVEERGDYAGFWRHRRKDGALVDVEIISHPLSFEGRPAELVLVNDITERKRAEQALLESELKYRELVENANSIILRWTPAGVITFINEFGLKFFGYSEEELLGRQVVGTIQPPMAGQSNDLLSLVETIHLDPDEFERKVTENMRRGGERVWVSWTNKAVFDDWGRVVEVFSVGSDVTERKRAEEELERHRERLEEMVSERTAELRQAMMQLVQAEKLAALGNLVAGVAHELNTPLGNTRIVASLLSEQFREFAGAVEAGKLRRSQMDGFLNRGREAVELLERNSARAADLVGHFKQVAVDQSSARRRSFDLRQTVEEMLVTLRLTFKRTQHRIELDIPAGLEMDSYPGPLEQVITNLVGNSLTHGFVGIEQGCIELQAQAVGETQVVLRCVDNGVGIPTATLHRLFEPFFTSRLGQGGSGLGLYIAYNLVTGVLGGTIGVESSPGHGATFTLTLPRTAPDRTAPV
ncbi:MAG: PAS domain S-box protein [Candidatus Accumulibacter sp.]|jgi:PAS domain S-box-containing protein|nr:PAS domain S-box protein [Candidatus Accumulibacter necessarius]